MGNFDSVKPYKITFEKRPSYLYAYVEGEQDSYEISRQYWQEIAGELKKEGYKKVLIDENITGEATVAEAYQLSTDMPKLGYLGIKVAFVDRFLDHQDLNQFGELVAINRGINGKIFNSVDEAEKWLLAG